MYYIKCILFCNLYRLNVFSNRKFQVVQHLETAKRIGNCKLKEKKHHLFENI